MTPVESKGKSSLSCSPKHRPLPCTMLRRPLLVGLGYILWASSANAQGATAEVPHHIVIPAIEPRPEDVSTIDGIIKASYETISGPAGQPRQWGRDRTLYLQNVYYVQTGVDLKSGKVISQGMT